MHNFKTNYDKILEVLDQVEPKCDFLKQIRKPKLRDKELIAIGLTAEYMGIDSECQLFRALPLSLAGRIERSVYNRRRRRLFVHMESLRLKLVERIDGFENCYIVDSMPLEVCKLSRSGRSSICKERPHSSPNKGYCASQAMHYYGYKLHAVCSVKGVIGSMDISPASVHDIHFLKDIITHRYFSAWKRPCAETKRISRSSPISSKNQENVLKPCSHNYATSL